MELTTWNKALFERLREHADARRLVHLYLDRDVLADCSGISEPSVAVEDFTKAFLTTSGQRPFGRALSEARTWAKSGYRGEPPMIAALGMTVLAVTEDPLGASHNVYSRQNALLGLPEDGGAPPGYTEDVPALWEIWNEWLGADGNWLGRPSASAGRHFVYQGWARSQGLIRARDRSLMAEYFGEVRPEALVNLSPDAQAREFIAWLNYRGPRTKQFRSRLLDASACQILSEVLTDELERWLQGKGRMRPSRRASVPALLFYDEWDDELELALEVDSVIAESPVDLGHGLETVASDEPVRVLTTGISRDLLLGSAPYTWELRDGLALQTRPKQVYVFREDHQLGGRIEVRGGATAEKYFVLVNDTISREVEDALDRAPSSAGPGRIDGWTWFESAALATASSNLRALGLGALARPQGSKMSLLGGQRIAGRNYLDGGAPDIFVPLGHDVRLDGDALVGSVGAPVALPGLALGHHLLEDRTDGETIRFEVISASRGRARGSDREWPLREASAQSPGGLATVVSGAAVSAHGGRGTALAAEVREGDRVLVVDDSGGAYEVMPPRERWLVRANVESYLIDIYRTVRTMLPRPAFVLICSSHGRVTAVEIPRGAEQIGRASCRERVF